MNSNKIRDPDHFKCSSGKSSTFPQKVIQTKYLPRSSICRHCRSAPISLRDVISHQYRSTGFPSDQYCLASARRGLYRTKLAGQGVDGFLFCERHLVMPGYRVVKAIWSFIVRGPGRFLALLSPALEPIRKLCHQDTIERIRPRTPWTLWHRAPAFTNHI